MINIYKTDLEDGCLKKVKQPEVGCWIDLVMPNEMELDKVAQELNISKEIIKRGLDHDEQPRVDIEDDNILFIVDVPFKHERNQLASVKTIPLGILLIRDEYFLTISLRQYEILEEFKSGKVKDFQTYKKSRFTIQILYKVATIYLRYLQIIHDNMEKAEDAMIKATQNKELVNLMGLEKSLVYITTALKSNEIVLEKILKGNTIDLYIDDQELLEDAIIENNQGIEMANLYREILSSMTDTFATIISNNLNGIMKFLAGITIVLSIPTMVASFMGMNVPLGPFTKNPMSFWLLSLIAILLSLIVAYVLKKKDML